MSIVFFNRKKIKHIKDTINTDPEFKLNARFMTDRVHFAADEKECIFDIRDGELKEIILSPCVEPWSYSIKGTAEAWKMLLQPVPPPFHDSLWTNLQRGNLKLEGNLEAAYAHFWVAVRIIEILKQLQNNSQLERK